MSLRAVDGRAARLVNPLGLGDPRPALSWRLEATGDERDVVQTGYRIQVADGGAWDGAADTGWVTGDRCLDVPWPASPLTSRARRAWRVMARTTAGDTPWSEPWTVEAGLLNPADWSARFAGPAAVPDADPLPAWLVRRGFDLPAGEVTAARVHVTALGLYELEINGTKVGDEHLAPGWSAYQSRLLYRTHDVTALVRNGANAIGATLAEGWFAGRLGWRDRSHHYGERPALLVQLEVTMAGGETVTVGTDETWRTALAGITAAGLYDGETFDARLQPDGWSRPGFDDSGWPHAVLVDRDLATVTAATAPPVRAIAEVAPVDITRRPDGTVVVDFGQNVVGHVRLDADVAAGDAVTVRHAEILNPDGSLRTDLLRTAKATDTFVGAGSGRRRFHPRFTFHGFRYAEITGAAGLEPGDVTAVVVSSDLAETGEFACSDERINRLHENVRWSLRGNFVSLPTDCPQRDERLGWTGDAQVFAATACFLSDAGTFLSGWLADLALDQRDDGAVAWVVPNVLGREAAGAAGWGDVAACMPWDLYVAYGDAGTLSSAFPAMCRWVDYELARAGDDLLWTGDFQFGDWLDPDAPPDKPASAKANRDLVATAYLARSLALVTGTARVLGEGKAERRYGELAGLAAAAWWAAYGEEALRSQTGCALALRFGLCPPPEAAAVAERLAVLVAEAGDHLGTGFLGTPLLLPALADHGYADTAYRVLLQTTPPSWLYPVLRGATTIWERWDALRPDGTVPVEDLAGTGNSMVSYNHYAYGAVAEWLHTSVAGLAPDPDRPGYHHVVVRPRPGGGLTGARARLVSRYGPTEVSWRRSGSELQLDVELPPNTTAEVWLPDGSAAVHVGSGRSHFVCACADPDSER